MTDFTDIKGRKLQKKKIRAHPVYEPKLKRDS